MEISIKNYVPMYQEGGAAPEMAAQEAAPAPQAPAGGGDPMQELLMACQQALQGQDCNLAMQVCQMLLQMAGGGGGAEQPMEAPADQQPVYRRGGRLVKWIRK